MDQATKTSRLEDLKRRCREQGRRCTVQRRLILEAVLDLGNHPTADQVYEAVVGTMPGISRTTVYRTLETLARIGVISKACHPGSVARYDGRIDLHHHLICLSCDAVMDISDGGLDALRVPDTSIHGFEVLDFRVQLRGLCWRCREQSRKEESS